MPTHTPPSYWHTTIDASDIATIELPRYADVAVIGGGLLGVATCYWLARSGVAPVLIERHALASGATGRNGGLTVAGTAEAYPDAIARLGHTTAAQVWSYTITSRKLLQSVLEEEGIACDYRERGHLNLATTIPEYERQQRITAALHADGFDAQMLDRAEVQELIHTPLGPEIVGGMVLPQGAALHSGRLVLGLARAAQRHGAVICPDTACIRLEPESDGIRITTTSGTLKARAVVVAVNAWIGQMAQALARLVTPVRGQVLAYAPAPHIFTTGVSANLTPTGEYWQQTFDGSIILGGCRAVAQGQDIGVDAYTTSADVQSALEQVLPRLFPQIELPPVALRWSGVMAFTPDYLPIADRAPELPNTWLVGGFSGHGMPFGMALGHALATAAIQQHPPDELHPFRINRATLFSSQ